MAEGLSRLDRFRQEIGEYNPVTVTRDATVRLGSVAAAGAAPAERLEPTTRWFLWIMVGAGPVGALISHWSTQGFAHGNSLELLAYRALSWPASDLQQVIAVAAAAAILLLGITTSGFTRVRPHAARLLLPAVIAVALCTIVPALIVAAFIILALIGMAVIAMMVWIIFGVLMEM